MPENSYGAYRDRIGTVAVFLFSCKGDGEDKTLGWQETGEGRIAARLGRTGRENCEPQKRKKYLRFFRQLVDLIIRLGYDIVEKKL